MMKLNIMHSLRDLRLLVIVVLVKSALFVPVYGDSLLVNGGYSVPGGVWGANDTLLFRNGSLGNNGSYGQWWKWNVYREAGTATHRYLKYQNRPNAAEILMSEYGINFRTTTYSGNQNDLITMHNRMSIHSSGNIGIGTTNPESKFHVLAGAGDGLRVGNASRDLLITSFNTVLTDIPGSTNGMRIVGPDYSHIVMDLQANDGSDGFYIRVPSILATAQNPIDKTVFAVQASGKVGIGTSAPGYKLDVAGTIRAEEIIVQTSGADYVFEDNYKLRSLSEVESHIAEHGHLPGVAPASEMASSGISLGDSQRVLLEKIEELTLYIISQDKEKTAMQLQMATLLQRLEKLESN